MTKHRRIFEALHREIADGSRAPGSLLPSEKALGRRWDVSRPTVARALRDLQALGLVERRRGSGSFVRPQAAAKNPVVGLFVNSLNPTEIMEPLCAEITRALEERGCTVFTGRPNAAVTLRRGAREWAVRGVKGVVFSPEETGDDRLARNRGMVAAFLREGIKVVLLDRDLAEHPDRGECDVVGLDHFHAGAVLGKHLVACGAGDIVFFARSGFPPSSNLRHAGLENSTERRVAFHHGDPVDRELVRRVLREGAVRPAVVCANDLTAGEFLQTAAEIGLLPPRDFLLAGFDDVRFARLLSVPLTTISQPCREVGIACADAMLGRIERPHLPPRWITLAGSLVERRSTGSASGGTDAKGAGQ